MTLGMARIGVMEQHLKASNIGFKKESLWKTKKFTKEQQGGWRPKLDFTSIWLSMSG